MEFLDRENILDYMQDIFINIIVLYVVVTGYKGEYIQTFEQTCSHLNYNHICTPINYKSVFFRDDQIYDMSPPLHVCVLTCLMYIMWVPHNFPINLRICSKDIVVKLDSDTDWWSSSATFAYKTKMWTPTFRGDVPKL